MLFKKHVQDTCDGGMLPLQPQTNGDVATMLLPQPLHPQPNQ